MALDYRKTAEALIEKLGGRENIETVTHCATRLRFVLRDESKLSADEVKKVSGVITVVRAGGQLQAVIGNHVQDVYRHVNDLLGNRAPENAPKRHKAGVVSRVIDVISGVFAPFLYTLAACGILQGILGIFVALGWVNTSGGTYQILNFVSWTAFTFLPVLIAITASKKFDLNVFTGVVIACALVSPDYLKMIDAGLPVHFLGLPVQLLSYTSSVIPILLAIWAASYIQRFFHKLLPLVVRNLFTPLFTIAIMVPLTLLAFGPVGSTVGNAIGGAYNFLYNLSPIVAGVVVGGLWEVLVIFGVHWGITPVTVGNYASLGYDTFTGLQASAVFAQAGAALGVALKTRSRELRKVSLSAAVTGLFGITEPAIYGVTLRFKKPMICGCIAGAVGGGIAGAMGAVSWTYNMPGIATLPAYFKESYLSQFLGLLLSIAVSFILAAVLTYIVGFADEPIPNTDETLPSDEYDALREISCPVRGEVIPLNEVSDAAFASGELGNGVGIRPREGKIYAPFDGKVDTLAESNHAIGLKAADGTELLLHIGIDTVRLGGKGFDPKIESGAFVQRGDLLLEFDLSLLKKEGFDPTVVCIVTEAPENRKAKILHTGNADSLQPVLKME